MQAQRDSTKQRETNEKDERKVRHLSHTLVHFRVFLALLLALVLVVVGIVLCRVEICEHPLDSTRIIHSHSTSILLECVQVADILFKKT